MGVKKNCVKGPSPPRNRRKLEKNIPTQVTGSSVKKVNQFLGCNGENGLMANL